MIKDRFYKEINIWKPVDDRTVTRYRCFEIMPEGKFFVQSSDYIYEDSDEKYRESLDDYFFDSLSKENFEEMSKNASETLEEAIAKHEADFKDMKVEFEELRKVKS